MKSFIFNCRSRLAAVTVSLPSISGLDLEDERNVISLLCSIFSANHGAGEAAGEDKCFSLVRNCLMFFPGNPLIYFLKAFTRFCCLICGNVDA